MDKKDYQDKMMQVLDNNKYSTLQHDLTVKVENRVANTLKGLRNEGHLDEKLCAYLTPQYCSPPTHHDAVGLFLL